MICLDSLSFFFFQAEDGIRDKLVTGVQTCALPILGTIFEELIRKFNEALNENPGEHFTPRDVVDLMVDLMLAGDEARNRTKGVVRTVYDPCCGSGGMLLITKEHITIGVRKNGHILRPP